MDITKTIKQSVRKGRLNVCIVIIINMLLFYGLFSYLFVGIQIHSDSVSAYDLDREAVDPGEIHGLSLSTHEAALEESNAQLACMSEGGINTIDEMDFYNAAFFRDYELGDIYYWELWDSDTSVIINAISCEIITYMHIAYFEGSLTQNEIETQAAIIANQFLSLPGDKTGPDTTFETGSMIETSTDYEDSNDTEEISHDWWYVSYDRTKDGIHAEDNIMLILAPNGELIGYRKNWNMNLDISTSYSVVQGEAESTALSHAGPGSSIVSSQKRIVRPNYYWTMENIQYGTDPVCVWEILVRDVDLGLRTYHIHHNENTIIGGDICEDFYG